MKNLLSKCVRTDLAVEKTESLETEHTGISNKVETFDNITISTIEVLDDSGVTFLEKPKGTYITIQSDELKSNDRETHNNVIMHLSKILKSLLKKHNIKDTDTVLVAGLGNRNFTPDTIGVDSLNKILVTNHIYNMLDDSFKETFRPLSALGPGVMGQTGFETASIIKGVVDANKDIKLVIAIDALAARSPERVNTTIQITDTGISPGSGVNNNRAVLDENYLNTKVIAIGVPTVIDLGTLIYDSYINFFEQSQEVDEEKLFEYIEDKKNLFVATKEIDEIAERLKNIIANGINLGVHLDLNLNDINDFML